MALWRQRSWLTQSSGCSNVFAALSYRGSRLGDDLIETLSGSHHAVSEKFAALHQEERLRPLRQHNWKTATVFHGLARADTGGRSAPTALLYLLSLLFLSPLFFTWLAKVTKLACNPIGATDRPVHESTRPASPTPVTP